MHIGHSRSSKVIDFGTNRKGVCDFLLVINSNFGPILYFYKCSACQKYKLTFDHNVCLNNNHINNQLNYSVFNIQISEYHSHRSNLTEKKSQQNYTNDTKTCDSEYLGYLSRHQSLTRYTPRNNQHLALIS